MSETLRDVRTKVSSKCWALIEAESRASGREQAEILREILHRWAEDRFRVVTVSQQLLKVTENLGADEAQHRCTEAPTPRLVSR